MLFFNQIKETVGSTDSDTGVFQEHKIVALQFHFKSNQISIFIIGILLKWHQKHGYISKTVEAQTFLFTARNRDRIFL